MKKLLVVAALMSTCVGLTASAANSYGKRFYAGFFANYSMPTEGDVIYKDFNGDPTRIYDAIDWQDGFGMGAFAGYHVFQGAQIGSRAELEISYQKLDIDPLNSKANLYDFEPSAAWKFMANAYVDVPVGKSGFTPYIGGGVGMATVDVGGKKGNDTVLAMQGIVGVSYAVSPVADIFADYRYIVLDDIEVTGPNQKDGNFVSTGSHNVAAGVRFSF